MNGIPKPANKKVFLVDDDTFLLEIYGKKFMEEGFDVSVATNGKEAWDLVQGGYRPDVIFTGIIMPEMTGFELVRKLQENPELAKIPVVIFSHRGRPEDKKTAKELNCDDFIVQGAVPLAEVVRRIELLLGIRHRFTVFVNRDHEEEDALVRLLELQQGISCPLEKRTVRVELEPKAEKGEFNAKLICD